MTIPELLQSRAEELGQQTFIIFEDHEFGYQDVHEKACLVAANLAKRGVGKGDKIVLLMGNCMEFVYLFLGAGRIGAVIVPVNPLLKPDEIAYITTNADATMIVTIPEFAPMVPLVRKMLPQIERIFVLGRDAVKGAEPFSVLLKPVDAIPEIAVNEHDDAALIYTSGTTGLPKGVILTHRNYIWNARAVQRSNSIDPHDRFYCILPLFHVNAQVVSVVTPLMAKVSLVLMGKFNALGILPAIEKHKITIMSGVPTIYTVICSNPKVAEYDISSIRFFVSGAAPLPEETYNLIQRVLKKPVIQGYGLSEATCASAVADGYDPIRWNSCGPALRYSGLRIVDSSGTDLPAGEIGEILVSGPTVMKGYYKNPEATAEVLKNGWLRTGDLGRLDEEGYLYIVGRLKDMIIRGGQNVYPAQVESVLLNLQGVAEAAVIGVDDHRWGQEVMAVIKRAEGSTITEKDVIHFAREHLAQYKCPRYVRFVDELPKTATGKVRKNVLAEQIGPVGKT